MTKGNAAVGAKVERIPVDPTAGIVLGRVDGVQGIVFFVVIAAPAGVEVEMPDILFQHDVHHPGDGVRPVLRRGSVT